MHTKDFYRSRCILLLFLSHARKLLKKEVNIIKKLKKYHMYECIGKKSKEKYIVLILSDETETIEAFVIPNDNPNYVYKKYSFKTEEFKKFYNFKEILLSEKANNNYKIKYIDKPELKIKINILDFSSVEEMIEYFIIHPNDDYKISFNPGTEKIIISKNNFNLDNENLSLPIFEIDKQNYEILKNFGFCFRIIDKFNISEKEMFLLLAHQFQNYYISKEDNIVTIWNDNFKTEFNGFLLSLPNFKKIPIEKFILKCNVKKQ